MLKRRIKLSCNFAWFPILRQTAGSSGEWGDCQFVLDAAARADDGEYDAWVVYNNLPRAGCRQVNCPRERTILILGEPPSRLRVNPKFIAQFPNVITCDPRLSGLQVMRVQQALPWWIGLRRTGRFEFKVALDFDALNAIDAIPKSRDISIVCSTLAITPQHRRRLQFVRRLKRHFGDRLELFGEGFNPIEDKWDAIAPFRYHVVLENYQVDDYWTEKLADCFLGGALPLYWGCPNIDRYFSPESLVPIDISRPEEAIRTIERALFERRYETALPAVWNSRRRVLWDYNFFAVVANLLERLPNGATIPLRLKAEAEYPPDMRMRIAGASTFVREGIARTVAKLLL